MTITRAKGWRRFRTICNMLYKTDFNVNKCHPFVETKGQNGTNYNGRIFGQL